MPKVEASIKEGLGLCAVPRVIFSENASSGMSSMVSAL